MKLFINLFIAVFFILGVIRANNAEDVTITGKVRYADNNEVVTEGNVKLFDLNGNLLAVAPITQTGDYILGPHREWLKQHGDLIGTPNTEEEEDFVPTGYPDQVNPANFVHVYMDGYMSGIDIFVQRSLTVPGRPNGIVTTVKGTVFNNNKPVTEAVVYAKQGDLYFGFGVTDSKGEYKIKNLPQGDYILVAHKIGTTSDSKPVVIGEKELDNVVFNVTPNKNNITVNSPSEYRLSQNYPNPFNPGTVINYSVPVDGFVSLTVYNTAGEQVAELMNASQQAGTYNIAFSGANLSSGVYYYMLKTAGFTETKKMILVK